MNLITNKYTHEILSITDSIDYDENGNPIDKTVGIGFFKDQVDVISNVTMPSDYTVLPHKYCYTNEKSFYENENYADTNIVDKITTMESNIDYLMLLNDTTEE